jgi:hypothetical protein
MDELEEFGFVPEEDLSEFGFVPETADRSVSGAESQISASDAALEGVKAGATFGFADEMAGTTQSGLDTIQGLLSKFGMMKKSPTQVSEELAAQGFTGDIGPTSSGQMYTDVRDEARAQEKLAMEQQPLAYFGGSLAGGAAVPMGAIGQLPKAASLGQKVLTGAKVGLGTGLVAGAGTSEAETIPEFAGDVALGGATGLTVGATLPPAISGVKAAGKELYNLGKQGGKFFLGRPDLAFKQGAQGLPLFGDEAATALQQDIGKTGKEIGESMIDRGQRLAKLKVRLIERAEKRGIRLDENKVDEFLSKYESVPVKSNLSKAQQEAADLEELLRSAKSGRIVKKEITKEKPGAVQKMRQIEELKLAENRAIESGVDPEDIDTVFEETDLPGKTVAVIRQVLRNEAGEPTGYKKLASKLIDESEYDPSFKIKTEKVRAQDRDLPRISEAEQLRKDLALKSKLGDEAYKTPEATRAATQAATELRDMIREKLPGLKPTDEAISNLNRSAEIIGVNLRDDDPIKVMGKFVQMLQAEGSDSITASKFKQTSQDFVEALQKGDAKTADKFGKELETLANRAEVRDILSQTPGALNWIQAMRLIATSSAGATGRLVGLGVQGAKNVASGARSLTKLAPQEWQNYAARAMQRGDKAGERLSQELSKLANSADSKARTATLFSIMQNPQYREILNQMSDEDGRENTK